MGERISGFSVATEHAQHVCRAGKGKGACSFLAGDTKKGFFCMKGTSVGETIIQMRVAGEMTAKGNYCVGYPTFQIRQRKEARF